MKRTPSVTVRPVPGTRLRSLSALLALPLGLGACGVEPDDGTEVVDNPIIGGRNDTGDPAVVALLTSTGSLCTSTLISPTVLLTAAHCVHPSLVGGGARFAAALDPVVRRGGRQAPVRQVNWHAGFNPRNPFAGNDIAVAILASPLPGVAPIPINRSALGQGIVGQAARLVGYGNNDGFAGTGAGTKRQVTTRIAGVQGGLVQIGTTNAGVCQGDSGGPAFLNRGGGEQVIGVTSFGQRGCRAASSFTRVDRQLPFIDRFLGATFSAEVTVDGAVEPAGEPAAAN